MKVSFNEYGQLVDEIKGRRLTRYLGTLVRNLHNVPLQVIGWPCVSIEAKEKMPLFWYVFFNILMELNIIIILPFN